MLWNISYLLLQSEEGNDTSSEEMKASLETMLSELQESRERERNAVHERDNLDRQLAELNSALSKRDGEIQVGPSCYQRMTRHHVVSCHRI